MSFFAVMLALALFIGAGSLLSDSNPLNIILATALFALAVTIGSVAGLAVG